MRTRRSWSRRRSQGEGEEEEEEMEYEEGEEEEEEKEILELVYCLTSYKLKCNVVML